MSTQWGQDPYGQEQDPYAAQQSPYGAAQSPYGAEQDPYSSGAGSSGDFQEPYGAEQSGYGAPQFGAGAQQPYPVGAPGPYGTPIAMAPPSSGLGIAGFILGLLSITACTGITGPFGLVLSIMGMRETSPAAASPRGGRGLAIAGLVLSILGTLILLAFVAYVIFAFVVVGVSASSGY